jgi:hypothetical protein
MVGAHHGRTTFGRSSLFLASLVALALPVGACGDEGVSSEEDARLAYVALDGALAKTLTLGMDGFNAATSANIPDQMGTGDLMGTITISGQVDMGASDNKGMRLNVELVDYQDMVIEEDETERMVIYDTDPAALPYVEITLRNIPDGTIEGTLTGDFLMTGELEGVVTLNLSFSGMIQEDGSGGVERAPGTVQVTGTATSEYGTYSVDVTI